MAAGQTLTLPIWCQSGWCKPQLLAYSASLRGVKLGFIVGVWVLSVPVRKSEGGRASLLNKPHKTHKKSIATFSGLHGDLNGLSKGWHLVLKCGKFFIRHFKYSNTADKVGCLGTHFRRSCAGDLVSRNAWLKATVAELRHSHENPTLIKEASPVRMHTEDII